MYSSGIIENQPLGNEIIGTDGIDKNVIKRERAYYRKYTEEDINKTIEKDIQ
jgi:hypothetical protein